MKAIYLDYAAATPLSAQVQKVMEPFMRNVFYNPSAIYAGAREAKQALETARANVARSIGARPSEVIFTAGGTESANLAIRGIAEAFPEGEIIVSAIEHDAVLKPAKHVGAKIVGVTSKGVVDLRQLEEAISDNTVLISVMYANNEVGSVQPLKEIVDIAARIRKQRAKTGSGMPLYVYTDACQAPQYLDINVARLGVDLMTLNGGKIYGPKQSGILYHRTGVVLSPQILGGGQEQGYRSGTENVAAYVGFAKALELSVNKRAHSVKTVSELAHGFTKELEDKFGAIVNGHRKLRIPNNIHVSFPAVDNERVLFSLDDRGVYAAAGSACSASSEEASHVLLAMGLTEDEARSSIRFSIGVETTRAELDHVIEALDRALKA